MPPFVAVAIAACVGVCGDRLFPVHLPEAVACVSVLGWLCWLLLFWLGRDGLASWCLLLSVAVGMSAWHDVSWRRYPASHIGLQILAPGGASGRVAIRGRVISVPESTPLPEDQPLSTIPAGVETRFDLRVLAVRHQTKWIASSGKVRVRVKGHAAVSRVGDHVQIFGELTTGLPPMNPGESDVRLADRTERILCRLSVPYPECVTSAGPTTSSVANLIGRLRVAGLEVLDEFLSPSGGELAGALLLGARDRLDPDRVDPFFHTGTIHLLAISGLHVGMLAWVFFVVARSTSNRRWVLLWLMCLAVVYCQVTGMRPPVLRAVILIQVVCVGLMFRRRIIAWNALAVAGVLLMLVRPAALFRPGAQLSFLAVAVLIWLGDNQHREPLRPIERLVRRSRSWLMRSTLVLLERANELGKATLAIWMITLPLVTHSFHLLSPISLPLNVMLAIPVAVGLLSGFIVLATGRGLAPLAWLAGGLCDRSLALFEAVVQFAHEIPGGWCWVAGPERYWCVVFYVGVGGWLLIRDRAVRRLVGFVGLCLWFAIPPGIELSSRVLRQVTGNKSQLECTFLCVGHGTCVVLELPDDRVVLYDCGRMGREAMGVRLVSEFLWHRGISHLDAVIVSHADADHYNILPGLMERFSCGQVFASPFMFESTAPGIQVLKGVLEEFDIPIRSLVANDSLRFGGAELRVLHPGTQRVSGSDNANSIVTEVVFEGRTILLPGDLERAGMDAVIAEEPRDVDVVMAPHHGSANSAPGAFLEWCSPEYVVISAGEGKMSAATRSMFQRAGRSVFHTAECGAISVSIVNGKLKVSTFLPINSTAEAHGKTTVRVPPEREVRSSQGNAKFAKSELPPRNRIATVE